MKFYTFLFIFLFLYACSNSDTLENREQIQQEKTSTNEITEKTNIAPINSDETINDSSIIEFETITKEEVDTKTVPEKIIRTQPDPIESIPDTKNVVKDNSVKEIKSEIKKPIHSTWNDLLKKYVSSSGKVNYKGLKGEKTKIDNYINQLTAFTSQTNWSRNEKLAYWINLYNALTVKLILDHYPIKSITDLYGGQPWDRTLVSIGSKSYSLNNIENDIIRPKFNDARIHFAVNCAAKSCPQLMNSAFLPEKLNYQLNKQANGFINGSKNNITPNAIIISKIFEWYKDDFKNGNIIEFLNQYSNVEITPNTSINFNEYDWNLNE